MKMLVKYRNEFSCVVNAETEDEAIEKFKDEIREFTEGTGDLWNEFFEVEIIDVHSDEKLIEFQGFLMTEEQREELSEALAEDILERYNNPEYLNYEIVESFAQDNKLKREK